MAGAVHNSTINIVVVIIIIIIIIKNVLVILTVKKSLKIGQYMMKL